MDCAPTISPSFTIMLKKMEMVLPDPHKGLSFADSIERLRAIPIRGVVWKLPKGKILPSGLLINYRTKDHPLINVARRMSDMDLMLKLKALSEMMERTEVTIK